MAASPSWDLMISYEHKLRKEAYRRTSREGRPLTATMAEVMADATLKETYFVTPLTLELARRNNATTAPTGAGGNYGKWRGSEAAGNNKQRPGPKGSGKGKSRKGRMGADSRAGFVYSTTPDGRQICYAYNSKDNTCRRALPSCACFVSFCRCRTESRRSKLSCGTSQARQFLSEGLAAGHPSKRRT